MNNIKPEERFFRKVPNNPIMFKANGTISSAVFKDSNGCSVDRQGNRDIENIYSNFISRFESIAAVVDVSNQNCIDVDAVAVELPTEDNIFHCEIHGGESKIPLTQSQAKKLSKVANIYMLHK